jgi:hypothetical protein
VHRVAGKELAELGIKLGRQRLVVREHQRGALHLGNDVGHGERLARPGHAHQNLKPLASAQAFHQRGNRLRLVSRGSERAVEFERHG